MHLLCSSVTHFTVNMDTPEADENVDTPEADGLLSVHNGMIKLNFSMYQVFTISNHHHQINM